MYQIHKIQNNTVKERTVNLPSRKDNPEEWNRLRDIDKAYRAQKKEEVAEATKNEQFRLQQSVMQIDPEIWDNWPAPVSRKAQQEKTTKAKLALNENVTREAADFLASLGLSAPSEASSEASSDASSNTSSQIVSLNKPPTAPLSGTTGNKTTRPDSDNPAGDPMREVKQKYDSRGTMDTESTFTEV
tara:strand:+ start:17 stop:577 length:561 start_codon:yes stop_codon:yes gene_type:complete